MNNPWLTSYAQEVNNVIHEMTKYDMRGSYGGEVDFKKIVSILQGSCTEIKSLQNQLNTLKNDKINLEKKMEKMAELEKTLDGLNEIGIDTKA